MDMTNQEYNRYVQGKAKPSPIWKDMIWAFIVGGLICTGGQGLHALFLSRGLEEDAASGAVSITLIFLAALPMGLGREAAGTWTSIALVFLSVLLTGLNVYNSLARYAGAGTLVPITGFANAVVAPGLEFKSEGFITGTAVKMFTIAGPVIVFGVSASVIYGLILCLFGLG